MAALRAAGAAGIAAALVVLLVSGGSSTDPRTPPALPGLAPPFLGVAVLGSGGPAAAVDAYGDVVDLRAPGPAGAGLIYNPSGRQAAGSVPANTGLVPRVSVDGDPPLPLWRADLVRQRYLRGTNVLRTTARFGAARVAITEAVAGGRLACAVEALAPPGARARVTFHGQARGSSSRLRCPGPGVMRAIARAARADRRWLARARPLGAGAPGWARAMYRRSLLVLRAHADRRSGAVAAGIRDGWSYVWPRDAGAVAIALARAGYRAEARRIARFLLGLDLGAAARFRGTGAAVGGRAGQGDAAGWVAAAARAAGLREPARLRRAADWRGRADYQEGEPGDYLANAIASLPAADGPKTALYQRKSARRHGGAAGRQARRLLELFGTPRGLVRRASDPASGLDSAAAWAVRPFPRPALFGPVRATLRRLASRAGRFGIAPGEGWPGRDPWSAPTAWSAWSLAALEERRAALRLLGCLRRAATATGALPERVDARSGVPRSTTPLAWSHAFAILALRALWPG